MPGLSRLLDDAHVLRLRPLPLIPATAASVVTAPSPTLTLPPRSHQHPVMTSVPPDQDGLCPEILKHSCGLRATLGPPSAPPLCVHSAWAPGVCLTRFGPWRSRREPSAEIWLEEGRSLWRLSGGPPNTSTQSLWLWPCFGKGSLQMSSFKDMRCVILDEGGPWVQ